MERGLMLVFATCAIILIGMNTIVLLGIFNLNIQANHVPGVMGSFDNNIFCIEANDIGLTTGASMRPRSFTGNTILWRDWDGNRSELKEGQIVWVQDENRFYSHTIYALYDYYLITWGDNNPTPDEQIPYSSVKKIALGVIYT